MKFSTDAEIDAVDLWREVDAACKHTKDRLGTTWEDIRNQYQSPSYEGSPGAGSAGSTPGSNDQENIAFAYGTWAAAQLVNGEPAVEAESPDLPDDAQMVQRATQRWIHLTKYKRRVRPLAIDHVLMWAVACVMREEESRWKRPKDVRKKKRKPGGTIPSDKDSEHEAMPMWPTVQRIPQHRYFRDPAATEPRLARFEGHKWIRTRDELLEEAKGDPLWNTDVIGSAVKAESDVDDETRQNKDVPDRSEIEGYQVWLKDIELPESKGPAEGFHGTIVHISVDPRSGREDQKAAFIRKPAPFYGPRSGPYAHGGVHVVPNDSFPLSGIVATKKSNEALNRIDTAIQSKAEKMKVPVLYDAKDRKVAQALQASRDDEWIGIPNFDPAKVVVGKQIGGLPAEFLVYKQHVQERLERILGWSETQQGRASSANTATGDALAQSNSDIRFMDTADQWIAFNEDILSKVAWYIAVDDDVYVPLNQEDSQALGYGGEPVWFRGGVDEDEGTGFTPTSWERSQIKIKFYSMIRTDEGARARRAMEAFGLVTGIVDRVSMNPAQAVIPWDQLIAWLGDQLNMPELERFLPKESLEMMAQMALGMQQGPATAQGPQARLGGDIPATPAAGGSRAPQGASEGMPGNFSGAGAGADNGRA